MKSADSRESTWCGVLAATLWVAATAIAADEGLPVWYRNVRIRELRLR